MKFRFFIIFFFVFSCTSELSTLNQKKPYAAKGFAYIYNDYDYNKKIIKSKMNNNILQISHQNLKTGSLIKIINSKNGVLCSDNFLDFSSALLEVYNKRFDFSYKNLIDDYKKYSWQKIGQKFYEIIMNYAN